MNQHERNEKIELYGNGVSLLKEALREVPQEAMQFKPAPDAWSIHEILVHIADSESNAALRARKLVVEPGGTVMAYDQDAWAKTLNYHQQNWEDALETTRLVRKTTYELLKTLPDDVFLHSLTHPEFSEPYTFETWIQIYSNHIPGHIEQIKSNLNLWREQK